MKAARLPFIVIFTVLIAACSAAKKRAAATAAVPAPPVPPVSSAPVAPASANAPLSKPKPANGVYAPGSEELTAIQANYKEVTMAQLQKGHMLYTAGACTQCHNPKNIYHHDATQWKYIVDDMAEKANLSAADKDAVYKYVLSIKATQGR